MRRRGSVSYEPPDKLEELVSEYQDEVVGDSDSDDDDLESSRSHSARRSSLDISQPYNALRNLLEHVVSADELAAVSYKSRCRQFMHVAKGHHHSKSQVGFDEVYELLKRFQNAELAGDTCVTLDYPNGVEPDIRLLEALRLLGSDKEGVFKSRRLLIDRKALRPDGCTHKPGVESCSGNCVEGTRRRVQLCISWSDYLYATAQSPR